MKNTHKHRKTMTWQSKSAAIAIAIMAMSLHSSSVQAMPEQGKVVAGQGEIARPDEKRHSIRMCGELTLPIPYDH